MQLLDVCFDEQNVECQTDSKLAKAKIMNATATYNSEHSWSRRCSTETVLSIQGRETDVARDTSDTEACDEDLEYEPVSEAEEDAPLTCDDTDISDTDNIISTQVIEVSVVEDREQVFADSEPTESAGSSDSEVDFHDYWQCAQCHADNNNPLFRYCEKCFRTRKHFFPPRPKRKVKRKAKQDVPLTLSQDSGVGSLGQLSQDIPDSQDIPQTTGTLSQELSQTSEFHELSQNGNLPENSDTNKPSLKSLKRTRSKRSQSADRNAKRVKCDSDTDDDTIQTVQSLVKTISDPSITIEEPLKVTKKVLANSLKNIQENDNNMCFVCFTEPKSGVFVHGRIAHICCCYKCAMKVWSTAKRCPICNRKVSNVLKAVIT